jgi:hypothetical protein
MRNLKREMGRRGNWVRERNTNAECRVRNAEYRILSRTVNPKCMVEKRYSKRQIRICTRPLKCISRDYVRTGFLFLNQLPLRSIWLSSKNLEILSSFLSIPLGRRNENRLPFHRNVSFIHAKVDHFLGMQESAEA